MTPGLKRRRNVLAAALLSCALAPFQTQTSQAQTTQAQTTQAQSSEPKPERTPAEWILHGAEILCRGEPMPVDLAQAALPGALQDEQARRRDGVIESLSRVYNVEFAGGAAELRVSQIRPGGWLRSFTIELHVAGADGDLQPLLQGRAGGDCVLQAGRRIRREGPGRVFLDQLDGDMTTVRWSETLEAPWPDGVDPGGPRVALVDSGLPYDLPVFRDRLARGPGGAPLGYDFWDLDPYPYDGDVSRGPFLPIRHGGAVASILAREAPDAALIPFRYPRPDFGRMSALVAQAAAAGARVLAMPLGGARAEDWRAFETALREHPQMLAIVSAGNNGRDIDAEPVYPASLEVPNMIVVTSADDFGRLAEGSNWGARSVDLMLPAENQPVIDFRGAQGRASGSSYAVPRVAALAVRLLSRDPTLSAEALKAAIFARAAPPPHDAGRVAIGWLPAPAED